MEIGFIYNKDFNKYNFGKGHPLTPLRIELTYSLMRKYKLFDHPNIKIINSRDATEEEITTIHKKSYVEKLKELNLDQANPYEYYAEYGLGPGDNPIFPGMFDAAKMASGSSMTAAEYIVREGKTRVFNISGGFHHARRGMASGFCLLNDVAIAIKYIQKKEPDIRIMYLDIDAHHGDGVQEIFYEDPNVLTLSFHQDGKTLFPGTGHIHEIGKNMGKYKAFNVPLPPKTTDSQYLEVFESIVPEIMKAYHPQILVLQSGVDTHYSDPLTNLGLSIEGHEKLFKKINQYTTKYCNNKLLAIGGGGYNISVVARSWTIFLATLLNEKIQDPLPPNWLEEINSKWPDSKDYNIEQLRDRNLNAETLSLKNPYWLDEIQQDCDKIIEIYKNQYIPKIKKPKII